MAARYIIRVQYVPGSIGLDGMSHEQTRAHMKAGFDRWTRWARNDHGCDISFRQVTSGQRIKVSFGSEELRLRDGRYALDLVNSRDRSRLWFLGDKRRPILRDLSVFARVIPHGLSHCFGWRAVPAADSYGHSRDPNDVFSPNVGTRLTTSLNWWRSLGGVIDGWKPKAKAAAATADASSLAVALGYDDIIACGCGLEG